VLLLLIKEVPFPFVITSYQGSTIQFVITSYPGSTVPILPSGKLTFYPESHRHLLSSKLFSTYPPVSSLSIQEVYSTCYPVSPFFQDNLLSSKFHSSFQVNTSYPQVRYIFLSRKTSQLTIQ
jgi:hypothetical protein